MDQRFSALPNLEEYMRVAQQAGLPFGTDKQGIKNMNIAQPLSRFPVEAVVRGEAQGQMTDLMDERARKVQRLAEADQKLSALYDDGGKLETNNPFLLEGALNTVTGIEGANIGATDQAMVQLEEGIQQKISNIAKFYSDMIATNTASKPSGGGAMEIDWDAEINGAVDMGLDEYSDEELNSILQEYGIGL